MKTSNLSIFPLNWRWTSKTHNLLLPSELEQIKPLQRLSANEVALKSAVFYSGEFEIEFDEELFKSIEFINADDLQETQKWLKVKMVDEEIIVSWDADTAVITNSSLFTKYWDDFCYPSSDDISIWPLNEQWVIRYFHCEKFGYARKIIA